MRSFGNNQREKLEHKLISVIVLKQDLDWGDAKFQNYNKKGSKNLLLQGLKLKTVKIPLNDQQSPLNCFAPKLFVFRTMEFDLVNICNYVDDNYNLKWALPKEAITSKDFIKCTLVLNIQFYLLCVTDNDILHHLMSSG